MGRATSHRAGMLNMVERGTSELKWMSVYYVGVLAFPNPRL